MIQTANQFYDRMQADISRKGYTEIVFPMSVNELKEAEQRYLGFLTLPIEEKKKFETWILGLHRDDLSKVTRFGYKAKIREKELGDSKEYFHHGDHLRTELESLIKSSPKEVRDFVEAADGVLSQIKKAMKPVYQAFETEVRGFKASFIDTPYIFLRFLAYSPPAIKPGELAIGHFDRGALTLAMYENRSGLQICPAFDDDFKGNDEEETARKLEAVLERLQQVHHTPDTAFLFASDGITSVLPRELQRRFPKGYHRVDEKLQDSADYHRRTAIVAFISPREGVSIGGWDERHPHDRVR
ncbi:MAG TPA: hypothetical protein VJI98_00300 [Candidatus Nanoarchaeia archaeon]|nr:hypothetical protein [Candidatus Nanoarchaeia archaeon]